MHDADVVHGDLTTSNIMIKTTNGQFDDDSKIVIIDFGLAMTQPSVEDKAVDLYVLERAFLSTHPNSESFILEILDSYKFSTRKSGPILERLEQVHTVPLLLKLS